MPTPRSAGSIGSLFVTTRSIEADTGDGHAKVLLPAGTRLLHLRSHGWWSGNLEYDDVYFDVLDGLFARTEVCFSTADVNRPPDELAQLKNSYGIVPIDAGLQ